MDNQNEWMIVNEQPFANEQLNIVDDFIWTIDTTW